MFRILIKETKNGVTKEPLIDLKKIKTERFQQIIGRYLLQYGQVKESYNNEGYKEYKFYKYDEQKNYIEVAISFWRISKEGDRISEVPNDIITVPPAPVKPMDVRLKEMYDDGVLTYSKY